MVVVHFRFDRDVQAIVDHLKRKWPLLHIETYVDHPWPGWDGRSIDVWRQSPEGFQLPTELGWKVRDELVDLAWGPWIRHYIFRHTLWTSFGGFSRWSARDHIGQSQHLHVTYWP